MAVNSGGKPTSRARVKELRAAGGVVMQFGKQGPEVLVVHRPRYDDWSFPKGKVDNGEKHKQAALREVEEETGVTAVPLRKLSEDRYRARGVTKVVRWWLMRPEVDTSDRRKPDDEVDIVRWIPVAEARRILTYAHDTRLLEEALEELDK
jgi:8-oxo-dGTP diphosphatase